MANEERRRHPRQKKAFYVAVKVVEGRSIKDDSPFGVLEELSSSGCLLLLPLRLVRDTQLSVKIGIGEHIQTMFGKVVHCRRKDEQGGYLVGLEFATLNTQQEEVIFEVLEGSEMSPLGEWYTNR